MDQYCLQSSLTTLMTALQTWWLWCKNLRTTQVGKVIREEADRHSLQEALNELCNWADKWEMRFNVVKCHVLHLGRNNLHHNYTMYGNDLEKTEKEKDIGVIISSNPNPTDQCDKNVRTATGVLHRILRAFSYHDRTLRTVGGSVITSFLLVTRFSNASLTFVLRLS